MIKQSLNSIAAKYHDLPVSRRSIIDLLATDKSRYFAQPRPIIVNYSPKAKWIYWWIFTDTKSRGIFTNIDEPEAKNCFSIIITQVIIEIRKQRNITILPQFSIVHKCSYHVARINVSRNAFLNSRFVEKKDFLWRSYRVKTNQNVVSCCVVLSTMGTLHYSFPKQCFLINVVPRSTINTNVGTEN